jgi:hypothetical protein
MSKHKWQFTACFRTRAYGWKGTALATKRMKEAVSEIKKVARTDAALAGEGAVELLCRLYPACEHIDGSSGSLGTALNRTVAALIPILIQADWDMNTRGRWLEDLYEAARSGHAEPATLLRATRDFAEKDPRFAVEVGIESIKAFLSGMSYELPTGLDVAVHYEAVMAVACKHGITEQAKAELAKAVCGPFGDRLLREALARKLQQDSPPVILRRENSNERPV